MVGFNIDRFNLGPIASIIIDRFGYRTAAIFGALIASTGLGFSILAPNVMTLYFTLGITAGNFLLALNLPIVMYSQWTVDRFRFRIDVPVGNCIRSELLWQEEIFRYGTITVRIRSGYVPVRAARQFTGIRIFVEGCSAHPDRPDVELRILRRLIATSSKPLSA